MPLPEINTQINRSSMRDEVYNQLLNWIMEGILRPGEKIVDKDLAVNLGVSRTPVREALRRLEDKDLVESSANRWTRVSKIPVKEPEMVYPIIWTLEKLAASLSIGRLTKTDIQQMHQANMQLKSALDRNDPLDASKADTEFHNVFINRSQNDYLIKTLQDIKIRFRRLEVEYFHGLSYDETSVSEHKKIISALQNRDLELAEKTIHSNWEKSLKRLLSIEIQMDNQKGESGHKKPSL